MNWMLDPAVMAAAGRAEVEAHRYNREENIPAKWLGIDANWRQRSLFDWSYLAASTERRIGQITESKDLSEDQRTGHLAAANEILKTALEGRDRHLLENHKEEILPTVSVDLRKRVLRIALSRGSLLFTEELPMSDPTTAPVDLNRLSNYLDLANDIAGESRKKVHERLPRGVRQVCLLWAVWMTSGRREPVAGTTQPLRQAIKAVWYEEGSVDLDKRIVFCREAGQEIRF